MESGNVTLNLVWLDEAFSKDYVDELEAACCLTDDQKTVYFGTEVSGDFVKYQTHPNLRKNYNTIITWRLRGYDLLSFIDKAIAKNLQNLRRMLLLEKCKEHFLNLSDEEQKKFIANYFYISRELELSINTVKYAAKKEHSNYPERLRYARIEFHQAPQDITRLAVKYSLEQTQKILEEAEKANFLVFAKVIHPDNTESFVSLTPTEVTAVRNNSPDRTNVIIGFFYCNIFELWVSAIAADELLGLPQSVDEIKQASESLANKEQFNSNEKESQHANQIPEKVEEAEPEWVIEARRITDRIALERWNSGIQQITARNICDAVASNLAKNSKYWGTKGPRTGGNIRKEALDGWKFKPPQE
jgi:hypothetical protein